MIKLNLVTLLLTLISIPSFGQECNCEENFAWVKKTFEENDAGFQYIIDKKGQNAYNALNQKTNEKAKSAETLVDCQNLIKEWSRFFRTGHFGFSIVKNNYNNPVDEKKIKEHPIVKVDFPKFEKHLY
ncbi:hypothetical protein SAMN05443634_1036 [Chishuiella changwenlii]|uniref:Uncharacterized protein n=1 Tax=Chishuiella changwenlii TaxID=1434701 RepID=A0A1M6UPQ4_9FLAO|nr:hypothetical protein [Chishuiella changwenlii]GGF11421.1 hypothetical protein GCM10010984_30570 [Chishuiella changwenlii]SHK71143.1 hypothetical protein SAMN05443634_1036 [Chishuiella changwenlii]